METIWIKVLNKKVQKRALVQKRSAIYTVMQNKFIGNMGNINEKCLNNRVCFSHTSILVDNRFVQDMCGE